jgi:hypothetical protein
MSDVKLESRRVVLNFGETKEENKIENSKI